MLNKLKALKDDETPNTPLQATPAPPSIETPALAPEAAPQALPAPPTAKLERHPDLIDRLGAPFIRLDKWLSNAPIPTSVPIPAVAEKPIGALNQRLNVLKQRLSERQARLNDEAAEREERKRRRKLNRELTEEAWFYMERILAVTARMSELSYRYKQSERDFLDSKVSTIQFSDVVLQPEAIYMRVNTVNMPRNVSIHALADKETLFNLSMACRHKVIAEYDPERGFWYVVERSTGVRGIPVHVRLDEVWAMRGPTHDGLAIPFGIGENKKPMWRSLTAMLSLLVAGTPGSGKSNLLNVALCTWIRFNGPGRLKLALIDLKGGTELGGYAEVPHLLRYKPLPHTKDEPLEPDEDSAPPEQEPVVVQNAAEAEAEDDGMQPALVEHREDVLPLLRAVYKEGRRRLRLLRQAGERNIGNYNWRHHKQALPHIVLVIDELAELRMLPQAEFEKVKRMLISVAQLFRSVGIHLVVATQTPTKQVISLEIKNAIPGRVAFSCPNVTASTLIIGNGSATGLAPVGRCILDWNGKRLEIQAPYIPDRVINKIIAGAIAGEYEEYEVKRHDVTEEEMFKVALEEFAGRLPADELYRHFNNKQRRIPRQEVRDIIARYLGKEVMVGSTVYRVMKGSGVRPPYLEVVEETK